MSNRIEPWEYLNGSQSDCKHEMRRHSLQSRWLFMLLSFAAGLGFALWASPANGQDDKAYLHYVLTRNGTAIESYAKTIAEPVSDRKLIESWLDTQPPTVGGPILDLLKGRTDKEIQECDEWQPDKRSIWDKIRDSREKKVKARADARKPFWACLGIGGGLAMIILALRMST